MYGSPGPVLMNAFIDASGDSGSDFTKTGTSTHFIVAALMVEESMLPVLEEKVEVIAQNRFQGSEIKSSKVGANLRRRKLILSDFHDLPFTVYALVVHKRMLRELSVGYSYSNTFHKNLHGKVDRLLLRTYPVLKIVADIHKNGGFMAELARYVERKANREIFPNQTFGWEDSKNSRLVQAADFFAGTFSQAFDEQQQNDAGVVLLRKVRQVCRLFLEEFPYAPETFSVARYHEGTYNADDAIARLAVLRAKDFLATNEVSKDGDIMAQMECVRFLLSCLRYEDRRSFVPTEEILAQLNANPNISMASGESLRRQVIGPLRDHGVLIASRSLQPAGYKIPCCLSDVEDFLDHYRNVAIPMLERVRRIRDDISMATSGKLDILSADSYRQMQALVQAISITSIETSNGPGT